jgi:hypothetical protein
MNSTPFNDPKGEHMDLRGAVNPQKWRSLKGFKNVFMAV